jgi:formylglycine-generating enzyme required for sulfatase activity
VDDRVPKELERICLKALCKRASERYLTAKDMAEDLRHFLAHPTSATTTGLGAPPMPSDLPPPSSLAGAGTIGPASTLPSVSQPIKIVPKGLRSFDAHDADFFLELLPGPRDRDGLPDSIRFWKTRIEETDADQTFSVGLICGPSGCGKSSLVKAGLLPRLSKNVRTVYLEATAAETETRLLHGLRKCCPDLPESLRLKEAVTTLRRGQGLPAGMKVLIVLDQFEQWLHAKKEEENCELVQALRQCDGGHVQCIVMVRDDFWMAVIRFMHELEIRLLEGQNSAAVDLFPVRHAEKVLAAFGRAFGTLPDPPAAIGKEQKQFIERAVSGLAQEGKVICVRLALFAEMMKGKAWTPATLKEVGGTKGVGLTFLEETFSAATAPPEHRYHQNAARSILNALLPEPGAKIKGHMRSRQELLDASGYASRPKDFDDVVRILDTELRLITPTDPEGVEPAAPEPPGQQAQPVRSGPGRFYQLTHDYLVHSLRDWLTAKQKETRRGRAELLLSDRASVWSARRENRQLPSLIQWLQIRAWTAKKNWTPTQRTMMAKATRYHAVRALACVALLALLGFAAYEGNGRLQAQALRRSVLDAHIREVPEIVADMSAYRRWIDPLLRDAAAQAEAANDSRKRLHASLALLPTDATQVDYLQGRLLDAEPHEVPVIRDALFPHREALLEPLWKVVEQPEKGLESQRLRAASALAKYDPNSAKWTKANALVVDDLVLENAVFLGQWSEAFRPVKGHLLAPLSVIFRDPRPERAPERKLATNLLADYADDQPQVLADLLMDADEQQFALLFPRVKDAKNRDRSVSELLAQIDRPAEGKEKEKEKTAKRQANAAVALLRLDRPEKVWPLLKHSSDPRARSYLIHRLGPLGASVRAIVERLDKEPDLTCRRALILSLGEFAEDKFTTEDRVKLTAKLQAIYRGEADPGLHAAAEWLLRTWKHGAWLKQADAEWAKDTNLRDKRLEEIKQDLANRDTSPAGVTPRWFVNGQGQTLVVIPGPVEFLMGSPLTEAGRQEYERQHRKHITETFALAAKAVTLEQYRQFDSGYTLPAMNTRTADLPVVGTSWFQAASYCNWLSKKEGIPEDQWCYETDTKGQITRPKANYLHLTGYRLPTEEEMEFATRAGAVTSRFFGETDELMPKYAWYNKNSQEQTWPVGSLKPNDLGLFDVQGNVYTWCQDNYKVYPTAKGAEGQKDKEAEFKDNGVLRGGSFASRPSSVRSATRNLSAPTTRLFFFGFRPARTIAY